MVPSLGKVSGCERSCDAERELLTLGSGETPEELPELRLCFENSDVTGHSSKYTPTCVKRGICRGLVKVQEKSRSESPAVPLTELQGVSKFDGGLRRFWEII